MKITGPFEVASFKKGDRVEIHPATDAWMRGDRFGTVEKTTKRIHVMMDKSGIRYRLAPTSIYAILE